MTEVETHTMGPWEVTDQNGDPEGSFRGVRRPTQINSLGKPYNTYVAQYCLPADALLIAAAPDLLEALKAMDAALCNGFDTQPARMAGRKALIAARAAIAKATQEQP